MTTIQKSKQKHAKLAELVGAYVLRHGGARTGDEWCTAWTMPTKFGEFRVSIHGDSMPYEGVVFGRFEEPERTHGQLGYDGPNPYSGKWNHHVLKSIEPEESFRMWSERMAFIVLPLSKSA